MAQISRFQIIGDAPHLDYARQAVHFYFYILKPSQRHLFRRIIFCCKASEMFCERLQNFSHLSISEERNVTCVTPV